MQENVPQPTDRGDDATSAASSAAAFSADTATPSRWADLRRRFLPVVVITIVVGIVGSLFIVSYSSALGNPKPLNVPIGLVKTIYATAQVQSTLEKAAGTTFKVTVYDSAGAARSAINHQEIYGAIVFNSTTAGTLYTSAASSNPVATLLSGSVSVIAKSLGVTLTVIDTHPLHPRDPSGIVLFYIALATVILGFVGALQVRVHAPDLSLGEDLIADVGRVVIVSLAFTVTILVIAKFETTPFFRLWGVLSLTMLVSSMTVAMFRLIVGPRWALLPTWIVFVVVANPASGGAIAPQLLPPFYQAVGRFLPTGAAVQAIRDLTYFPHAIHGEPYAVLVIWLVVTTSLLVVLRRRADRHAAADAAATPASVTASASASN